MTEPVGEGCKDLSAHKCQRLSERLKSTLLTRQQISHTGKLHFNVLLLSPSDLNEPQALRRDGLLLFDVASIEDDLRISSVADHV